MANTNAPNPLWSVHKSVYTQSALDAENRRLLSRVWQFVLHESELPAAGNYVTLDVAANPIVVARSESGDIRAFFNTCRHRGAVVATEEKGNARNFRCLYHNWVYGLDGCLKSLPGAEAYDAVHFKREDFGLVPVGIETFYGLVFICLDRTAMPLRDFLGPQIVELCEQVLGAAKYEVYLKEAFPVKANWKLIAENWRDGYHVKNVHPNLGKGMAPGRRYELVENGHCIQHIHYAPGFVSDELWESTQQHTLPGLEPLKGYHFHLFPGLVVQPLNNQFQILSQTAVDAKNSIWTRRALGIVGDSPEVRDVRRQCWQAWSSNQVPEDILVLELQQRGIMSDGMPISILWRGDEVSEGIHGDDNRLRQFWGQWRKFMGEARANVWPSGEVTA